MLCKLTKTYLWNEVGWNKTNKKKTCLNSKRNYHLYLFFMFKNALFIYNMSTCWQIKTAMQVIEFIWFYLNFWWFSCDQQHWIVVFLRVQHYSNVSLLNYEFQFGNSSLMYYNSCIYSHWCATPRVEEVPLFVQIAWCRRRSQIFPCHVLVHEHRAPFLMEISACKCCRWVFLRPAAYRMYTLINR